MPGTEPGSGGGGVVRLFLYGTLLDPRVLAVQAGEAGLARRAVPARLPGFRRVVLRGTPYPTLVRDGGGSVEGLLLRVGGPALRRLSAYEGALYRLEPVRVLTPRGPRRVRAWMAPARLADPRRSWDLPVARPGGYRGASLGA